MFLNNRHYQPTSGVFASVDAIAMTSAPSTLNPYTFSRANPLAMSDRSGMAACREIDAQNRLSMPAEPVYAVAFYVVGPTPAPSVVDPIGPDHFDPGVPGFQTQGGGLEVSMPEGTSGIPIYVWKLERVTQSGWRFDAR